MGPCGPPSQGEANKFRERLRQMKAAAFRAILYMPPRKEKNDCNTIMAE